MLTLHATFTIHFVYKFLIFVKERKYINFIKSQSSRSLGRYYFEDFDSSLENLKMSPGIVNEYVLIG